MQNTFAFDWMFDFLSLGTTYLYRKYMIGAVLAGEDGAWRRLGSYTFDGPERPFNFEKFNEAYPDFVRGGNPRLCPRWPETIGRPDSNVDDEDRSLRTQVRILLYIGVVVDPLSTRLSLVQRWAGLQLL
jgi:hypothetical protein